MNLEYLNVILAFIETIPWYGWVGFIAIVLVLFGDQKKAELEATFQHVEDVGSGEVEVDIFKRKAWLYIKLKPEPAYQHKSLDIFIDGEKVYTVEHYQIRHGRFYRRERYRHSLPQKGSRVEVKCEGQTIMSALMQPD